MRRNKSLLVYSDPVFAQFRKSLTYYGQQRIGRSFTLVVTKEDAVRWGVSDPAATVRQFVPGLKKQFSRFIFRSGTGIDGSYMVEATRKR